MKQNLIQKDKEQMQSKEGGLTVLIKSLCKVIRAKVGKEERWKEREGVRERQRKRERETEREGGRER